MEYQEESPGARSAACWLERLNERVEQFRQGKRPAPARRQQGAKPWGVRRYEQ
jgi:hypothetical protein